jgi:mono/diheme cytochrome c family protein
MLKFSRSNFISTHRFHTILLGCLALLVTGSILVHAGNSSGATRSSNPRDDDPSAKNEPVDDGIEKPQLEELKRTGFERSRFRNRAANPAEENKNAPVDTPPQANLQSFQERIQPLLTQHCVDCHGPDATEGNIRIDTLDPNLLHGKDTDWWVEIFAVVTKGEMPPPDDSELSDADRQVIVDWLSGELQAASLLKRKSASPSNVRRLTRYEYNYALQDLLGLPWDFAKDLPPEPRSAEGFENSSELLHLSVSQFETYHRLAREALQKATVRGDQPPVVHWGVAMQQAAEREWVPQDEKLNKANIELAEDPEKLRAEIERLNNEFRQPHRQAYYKQLSTGRTAPVQWSYYNAKYAFAPADHSPSFPGEFDTVAIIPASRNPRLVIELGNQLPDEGTMRVTIRASRVDLENPVIPSVQLMFGWQASNEGRALLSVSSEDTRVTGTPDEPQLIQWDVPLGEIYPRNTVRKTSTMGATPSPSEYIRIANTSASPCEIQVDFVKVEAPVYDQWPPTSHQRIFGARDPDMTDVDYAKQVIEPFMRRAWRRNISPDELDRKMALYETMRGQSESVEEAILEVLATVLSSPQFLLIGIDATTSPPAATSEQDTTSRSINEFALATRLALFLWCSLPDDELLHLATTGQLSDASVLATQVERMLDDPRSQRFARHFVHQWLKMELLEFVNFKQHVPGFDPLLKEAMQQEPVEFFQEVLRQDGSVLDFLHADYAVVNERLARHYGWSEIRGNHFQRVTLPGPSHRGGLLTQAGFLAMNSDWPDSHPLKRAIWLLECLLDDPPPPPPPAVPQIDLANPEIAKMTLKERIEDHRNHAACRSCHIKIDPWGIAFENYDALGQWRDQIKGKPVDASSELFNRQTLNGMDGLKRFLLEERQDQFVQAMVGKVATFALGRTPGFEDRAAIDQMTAAVREKKDGLRTLIFEVVQSELFQSK